MFNLTQVGRSRVKIQAVCEGVRGLKKVTRHLLWWWVLLKWWFHFFHSLKFHTSFLFHWFCLVIWVSPLSLSVSECVCVREWDLGFLKPLSLWGTSLLLKSKNGNSSSNPKQPVSDGLVSQRASARFAIRLLVRYRSFLIIYLLSDLYNCIFISN